MGLAKSRWAKMGQEMVVFDFAISCYSLHFSHVRLIEKVDL